MNTRDISEAKDPDMRTAMAALKRAALQARKTAIETGTRLIIVKDDQLLKISPAELRQQIEPNNTPAS